MRDRVILTHLLLSAAPTAITLAMERLTGHHRGEVTDGDHIAVLQA
jgi:hypothetical protein